MIVFAFDPNKTAQIDRLFQPYNGEATPGAAVMVIKNGKPIFKKAYGLANLDDETPVTLATNFRLASVTKQFTAMCVMMLVQSGRLGYDHNLQQIFPEFPAYGRGITIRHLLQHTSGLIAYEDLIPDTAKVQVLDEDVLRMMMTQDSTHFPPGSQYRYSNSGYAVLAMVVEKASGKSFAQFLQENIFAPLGMKRTVAYQKGFPEVEHRAMGYSNVIVRYPGAKFTVIILTNRAEPEVAPLADKLTDVFL
jgi:CubicO group peptidase (beta-lactamase class C family)